MLTKAELKAGSVKECTMQVQYKLVIITVPYTHSIRGAWILSSEVSITSAFSRDR